MLPRLSLFFLSVLILAASCSKPASYECFIKAADAPDGVYNYELDFTDSTATYDISFYTPAIKHKTELAMNVAWSAMADDLLYERVYMTVGKKDVIEKYRSDTKPCPPAFWRVSVQLDSIPDDFKGLGIICVRNGSR